MSSFSVACSCLLLLVFVFFVGVSDYSVGDSAFTPIFFMEVSFVLPPPPSIFISHPPVRLEGTKGPLVLFTKGADITIFPLLAGGWH